MWRKRVSERILSLTLTLAIVFSMFFGTIPVQAIDEATGTQSNTVTDEIVLGSGITPEDETANKGEEPTS
ncbi:hypothetical protein, partial [Hydrogenoanaerobacterium sp.]|uniref:hypothetical protein n=1 Tax=Hydrogenoanaerobacterium sp. TaxID=2953763 RepID=UPI0028A1A615